MPKHDFRKYLVKDLRQHLKKHGHPTSGKKAELIGRLKANKVSLDGLVSSKKVRKPMGDDKKKVLRERLAKARSMRGKSKKPQNVSRRNEVEKVLGEESVATDVKDSFRPSKQRVMLRPSPNLDNSLKDVKNIKASGNNKVVSLFQQVVESLDESTARRIIKSKGDVRRVRAMIMGNKDKSVRVLKGMIKELVSPNVLEDMKEEVVAPLVKKTTTSKEFVLPQNSISRSDILKVMEKVISRGGVGMRKGGSIP